VDKAIFNIIDSTVRLKAMDLTYAAIIDFNHTKKVNPTGIDKLNSLGFIYTDNSTTTPVQKLRETANTVITTYMGCHSLPDAMVRYKGMMHKEIPLSYRTLLALTLDGREHPPTVWTELTRLDYNELNNRYPDELEYYFPLVDDGRGYYFTSLD